MTAPYVSILMSVHNGECYLHVAVESILRQSFTDFELVIIDDASTDNSRAILESFADERIRIIPLSLNGGLAKALNLAASLARAPLLARMDADDVALPNRLEWQIKAFRSDPDLILLGTAFELIDGDGHVFGRQKVLTDDASIREQLLRGNAFAHPTVMMRADCFSAVGGYRDIGGRYAQDYDLWLRLADRGHIANLGEALLQYRVHDQQVSVDKLLLQRQTAELYHQLALQRRMGLAEDIKAAKRATNAQKWRLRAECAAELLTRSAQFEREGRRVEARLAHWRAFRMAPFSQPVRKHMAMALFWRWQQMWAGR